ncbi:5' nucleotidase, NT5C type [Arthrobacter sp. HLT1-21]
MRTFVNGPQPTILWDMDGTFVVWDDRHTEILLSLDSNFPVVPKGTRVGFDYFWVEGADHDTIMASLNDPRLYDNLDPIEGMIEAMLESEAEGYENFIVSTPTWTNPGCVPGKLADIERLLGPKWVNKLILTHDKTVVRGDVLVDDKPRISGAHTPTWQHLMFHQDYNSHIDTPHRLTDPREWRSAVSQILGLPAAA